MFFGSRPFSNFILPCIPLVRDASTAFPIPVKTHSFQFKDIHRVRHTERTSLIEQATQKGDDQEQHRRDHGRATGSPVSWGSTPDRSSAHTPSRTRKPQDIARDGSWNEMNGCLSGSDWCWRWRRLTLDDKYKNSSLRTSFFEFSATAVLTLRRL